MTTPPEELSTKELLERVRRISRDNDQVFRELVAGQRRLRRLARSVWRVQEEERRRLARELHDGLGQTLSALKQSLDLLALDPALDPALSTRARCAAELARTALSDTRELSRLLRPPILDDLGLEPALGWLVRTVGESSGLGVRLAARIDRPLGGELETVIFRCAQEALSNAVRHAAARVVEVAVMADVEVRLTVRDDGRGLPSGEASRGSEGSGLAGMRDRVESFGGSFRVDSEPGAGTVVEVVLPIEAE